MNIKSQQPLVSIVSVNYDQPEVTCEMLASLEKVTYPNFETLIVDNASPTKSPNIIKENITIVKYAYSRTKVYLAILGISWFWFIGAAILAQIPLLTKDILGADESVATLFLAVFSIGVGVGSFLCSKRRCNWFV